MADVIGTLAQSLAEQALGKRADELPAEALEASVFRLLDTVGVALAGAATPVSAAVRAVALRGEPAAEALVWGSGQRAPLELAVFANATAAHALDFDDANYDAVMHAGASVVPVAVAVAEEQGSTGQDLLASIACGYEVASYLGKLAYRRFQPRGFHSTSVLGVLAAAAVAGRLRGISAETLRNAFSISGSLASGLMEFLNSGGDTKPLQVGWAARSGLAAVALAEAGAAGPVTVLEGGYGIFRSFAGAEVDRDALTARPLWSENAVSRAATKFYEVCGAIHGPADAWKSILTRMQADGVSPFDDIVSISCSLSDFAALLVAVPHARKCKPQTAHEARFSLPWCLARIALDGEITDASFRDEMLFDPRAQDLAERVTCFRLTGDEEKSTLAAVEARTKSGSSYREKVPPSSREGGTPDRIIEKVRRTAGMAGDPAQVEELIAGAQAILSENSLSRFSRAIRSFVLEEGKSCRTA